MPCGCMAHPNLTTTSTSWWQRRTSKRRPRRCPRRGSTSVALPKEWLFKAALSVDGPVLVDVLHRINRVPVDAALIERADIEDVLALAIPVLSPTEILTQKLRALHEHHCDFAKLLPLVRAVREQLDWSELRQATAENPFAVAFLSLCGSLGISEKH